MGVMPRKLGLVEGTLARIARRLVVASRVCLALGVVMTSLVCFALGIVITSLVCFALATPARAQTSCESESQCSFKKPNVLLVLDYSSSMRGAENAPAYFPPGQTKTTRWDAALDASNWILRYDDGFFANNARIGLSRFAHDPDPKTPATTIPTDKSFPPITDGFALDVPFDGSNGKYLECKGSGVEAAIEVLHGTPPPPVLMNGDPGSIMLTWTRGALHSARTLVDKTRLNHLTEPGEGKRDYEVVLMTDGDWTCPDRFGQNCDEDPAVEAALLKADGIPVHVIAFGDATMQPSLDETALQGGTVNAIDATSPKGIVDAFTRVLDRIRNSVIVPSCTQKLPRVLIVMDGSTSMIVGNAPGQTKWDKARFALTGNPAAPNPTDTGYVEPVLTRKIEVGGRQVSIEDVVHLGLVAFAGEKEQKLMANFAPCMRDNFGWAMDPNTSCVAPGCTNPYGGYPLSWTFKNSDTDRDPRFVRTTHSFMPSCNQTQNSTSCLGQVPTTFTGQGLEFARKVIADYKQNSAPFSIDDRTRFVNVLITDGQTSEGSSDVQKVLTDLVAEGVDTFVIGFGSGNEIDADQLNRYAGWGNTKTALIVDPMQAAGSTALADALAGVVTGLGLDSCCVLNQCSTEPEPADPQPVCGDGHVNGSEVCDDGPDNATYGHCGGDCLGPHLFCGDGRSDMPYETCDDGNKESGDGCDSHCDVEGDEDAGVVTTAGSGAISGTVAGAGSLPSRSPIGSQAGSAATTPDAGAASAAVGGKRDDGCGCRLQRADSPPRVWLIGLLALCALRCRRRRRGQPYC
jgi:cysteine-rich repeat protein